MKIFITGIPGSGKTTTGERLAQVRSIPFHTEVFQDNPYLHGADYYGEFVALWQSRQLEDQTVFIADAHIEPSSYIYLSKDERDRLHHMLRGYDVIKPDLMIALNPNLNAVLDRIKGRNREGIVETELRLAGMRYLGFQHYIDKEHDYPVLRIDNSYLTIAETVETIDRMISVC